jgi:hypothetical protein
MYAPRESVVNSIADMFLVKRVTPELVRALHSCFRDDLRNGMVAVSLADTFYCFPEERRYDSFMELVEAVVDIENGWVHDDLLTYLNGLRLSDKSKCEFVNRLAPMLEDESIRARFRHERALLNQAEMVQLALDALPESASVFAHNSLSILAENPSRTLGQPRPPFHIKSSGESSMRRRMDFFRLIEREQVIEASPVEQLAFPVEPTEEDRAKRPRRE